MFRGGQMNPYDEIVAKATDENLTGENWEIILNLCDKVSDEGETGAREVVAAILKRLTHRLSNVQLYTLTLADALSKNCGINVHREIASRAFTQGLDRLITDRNTHDKVRKRALSLVAEWTSDFEKDTTLGIMEETYESLKNRGYKFDAPNEPPPPEVDDEIRRKEEEELQMVLEMSVRDKGGRGAWSEYSLASNGAGGSGASSSAAVATSHQQQQAQQQQQPPVYGGYVPSASPAVSTSSTTPAAQVSNPGVAASPAPSTQSRDSSVNVVTRVRALHTFEATEPGELAFEKGDIIKVVDRNYKDWWRGQLKGRTGIFPVNYVEPLPEPTAAELAKEAEQEAAVFAQVANVDRLLTMLRQMDPAKDNLADNEEIQELYRQCMTLRPKIVKLIDKYTQKRADLVSMNETFVKARTIFDRMMEESLARHSSVGYDQQYGPPYPRGESSRGPSEYPPQGYGWPGYEQPGYPGYAPAPGPGPYAPGPEGYPAGPQPQPPYAEGGYPQQPYPPQPYAVQPPGPYGAAPPQQQQQQAYMQPGAQPQMSPPADGSRPVSQTQGSMPGQVQGQPPQQFAAPAQAPPQQQPQQPVQPQAQPQQVQAQVGPQAQVQPAVQPQAQPQAQPQTQAQPPTQPQQQQPQPQQQQVAGPPFVYDPKATYPDANVQLWASYYAQGGTDPTGSVYFISVPGVKEGPPPTSAPAPVQGQVGAGGGGEGAAPLSIPQGGAVGGVAGGVGGAGAVASSPVVQQAQGQAMYQPGVANASNSSLGAQPSSPHVANAPGYGASPYPAPAAGPGSPTQAQGQPGWQAQYSNLPGQFANMEVGGEGRQGAQGASVGAPA